MAPADAAADFPPTVRELLDRADRNLAEQLPRAAALMMGSLLKEGLVYVGGAGHSLAMVCETFYRAGGLACVRPLWHPDILPLANALGSTQAERTVGLGEQVIAEARPEPKDVLVVFSNSGRNPYPVELARSGRERGVPVIAVTSAGAAAGAAGRAGSRLADHATVVLDTAVPAGDTVFPSSRPRTAAVSTLSGAYVWARLLTELDGLAEGDGMELPQWRSANMPGGDEANERLFAEYGARIPELGVHPAGARERA